MRPLGVFIKNQREKNNISQNRLASLLYKDRTVISKWENNKLNPSIQDIICMSEIFHISVEEFLFGEEYSSSNSKEIKSNFNRFLIFQNDKLKKFKMIIIMLIFILVIGLTLFLLYYFYNTYNTTKVYLLWGESEHFELKNGLFIVTREKSYLKLGNVNDYSGEIMLFYQDSTDLKYNTLYVGDINYIITDFTGYNSGINLNNFNDLQGNLYIKLVDNGEILKLNFEQNFKNDNVIFKNQIAIGETEEQDFFYNNFDKVKTDFKCLDGSLCTKEINNLTIFYDLNNYIFYFSTNFETAEYDIINQVFMYSNDEGISFTVGSNFRCAKDCYFQKEKYDYFMSFIQKYL